MASKRRASPRRLRGSHRPWPRSPCRKARFPIEQELQTRTSYLDEALRLSPVGTDYAEAEISSFAGEAIDIESQ